MFFRAGDPEGDHQLPAQPGDAAPQHPQQRLQPRVPHQGAGGQPEGPGAGERDAQTEGKESSTQEMLRAGLGSVGTSGKCPEPYMTEIRVETKRGSKCLGYHWS